ncbi:MAG: CHAT domain-containing protein, partial [Bacteroidota bacterium]
VLIDDLSGLVIQWPKRIDHNLYRRLLEGENKAEALRQAKLQYLDSAPPHALHPRYWAALVLTGEASPIQPRRSRNWVWLLAFVPILGMIGFSRQSIYRKLAS